MKTLVAAAFAVASIAIAPLPAASLELAATCSDSAPEEWKRPGGYCDQIGGGGSLSTPTTNSFDCPVVAGLGGTSRIYLAAVPTVLDACGNVVNAPCSGVYDPRTLLDRDRVLLIAC